VLAYPDGLAEGAGIAGDHEVSGKCATGAKRSEEIVRYRDLEAGGESIAVYSSHSESETWQYVS
jgi:hypothetical protein